MKPYVNLIPAEIKRQCASFKMLRRWYLLTIAALIIGILLACPSQAKHQLLSQQIFEVAPAAHRSRLVERQLVALTQQIDRMNVARNQHLAMTGQFPPLASISLVSEFCSQHPHSIQITSIDYANNRFPKREDLPQDILSLVEETTNPPNNVATQSPADSAGLVIIRAKLTDPALATTLLGTLKSSKLFKEVKLINHNVDREEESYISTIELTCKF